jgi:cytochrome bd ubiquinol oxidase subunit I
MNYPFWDIPYLGSGWVIGIIAIFHVMISQFAVGGGLYLPLAERKALREGRADWLKELVGYSKFFLVLTGVFGTISGVGIWFAIGLTHPEATSTLIHNFVFGWAIEWVFFIVELTHGRRLLLHVEQDRRQAAPGGGLGVRGRVGLHAHHHQRHSYLHADAGRHVAFVAGTGHEASKFWNAFFNPTYWPSLLLRVCVCASLAGIWALISASRIDGAQHASRSNRRWSSGASSGWCRRSWPCRSCSLVPVHGSLSRSAHCSRWASTPWAPAHFRPSRAWRCDRDDFGDDHRRGLLPGLPQSRGLQSRARGGHSAAGADGDGRRRIFARDAAQAVRHRALDVFERRARALRPQDRSAGYLAHSNWVWNEHDTSYSRGEAIFRGECGACHTLNGYRPLVKLLAGRDRANIESFITMLHEYKPDSPYHHFMPPMVGTKQDVEDLTNFLNAQVNPPATSGQKPVQTAQKYGAELAELRQKTKL